MDAQEGYRDRNGRLPRFPRVEINGVPESDPDVRFPCPGCDAWPCVCGGSGWLDRLARLVLPTYFAALVVGVWFLLRAWR